MTTNDLTILIGFIVSIIAITSPVIKLTKTMAELSVSVEALKETLNDITEKNHEAHARLWEHNNKQDDVINEHDKRISTIESRIDIEHYENSNVSNGRIHREQ